MSSRQRRLSVFFNRGKSNVKFEYLSEFIADFENVLGNESGAQMCSLVESRGRKSRATVPLTKETRNLNVVKV